MIPLDRKKKIIAALVAAALLLWGTGSAVYGVGFIIKLTGLCCGILALGLWLTRPFKKKWARKTAKALLSLMVAGAILAAGSFIWIEGLIISQQKGDMTIQDSSDVLIVLGAGLRGYEPSPMLTLRINKAAEYLLAHPDCVAILSGSQGPHELTTEASVMFDRLTAKGISPDRLYLEEEAHNTLQNIKYSVALMEKEGLKGRVAVVSSGFHLFRAKKIFSQHGIEAGTLSAPIPHVGLTPANSYVREYCSIVVMYLKNALKIDE